jgi:hypothetical protein
VSAAPEAIKEFCKKFRQKTVHDFLAVAPIIPKALNNKFNSNADASSADAPGRKRKQFVQVPGKYAMLDLESAGEDVG